jgi:hypothetical protein
MIANNFNNTDIIARVLAGLFAIIVSPTGLAETQMPKALESKASINDSQISNADASKSRPLPPALFLLPPPAEVSYVTKDLTLKKDVLGRAFNNDDWNHLFNVGGFRDCETSSRIPSFFEKNYSNFAASCLNEFRSRQAINFDERFRSNPDSQGIAVSPLGGRMQWSTITQNAKSRLLQRSINDFAQSNKVLANIVQGRVSIDFGIGGFFAGSHQSQIVKEADRPRYVVEVIESKRSSTRKNRPLIASLGRLPEGSVSGESHWFAQKPSRARRILKETYGSVEQSQPAETRNQQTAGPLENSHQGPAVSSETEALTSIRTISRMAGLKEIPLSKIRMQTERRDADGQNKFALRAAESQDLVFAEVPDLTKLSSSSLVWGYKIPWKKHSLSVRVDEGTQEKVTSYSFNADDSNKSEITYNHATKSLSAGFSVSF